MSEKIKKWWFFNDARARKVLGAGLLALIILLVLVFGVVGWEKLPDTFIKGNAIWTVVALIISSPVAFVIWHFRDENTRQQIENQRKDINLKEFQKIAEWVSGAHLQEDKITEKNSTKITYKNDDQTAEENKKETCTKSSPIEENQETSTERFVPHQNIALSTFSKRDGAIGLQIAAVHDLLPFYRGDHGESFQKPAVNLLAAAWLVLQQQDVQELADIDNAENKEIIQRIQARANSPLGIALTRVLLATDAKGQLLIRQHPEVFPNLCLAGMNLKLAGLAHETLRNQLFAQESEGKAWNAEDMQLQGVRFIKEMNFARANLSWANLSGANLSGANLTGTDLKSASLSKADLIDANLNGANLTDAVLSEANLSKAKFSEVKFTGVQLSKAILIKANLTDASLSGVNLAGADLTDANLNRANLSGANLSRADLSEANLSEANLSEVKFTDVQLSKAILIKANLTDASLSKVNLAGVDLTDADLTCANLSDANLNGADLSGADLRGTNLIATQALIQIDKSKNILGAVTTQNTLQEQAIFDDKTKIWQKRGLIILVESTEQDAIELDESKQLICTCNEKAIIHNSLIIKLDLAATEQLNPQWTFEIITQPK